MMTGKSTGMSAHHILAAAVVGAALAALPMPGAAQTPASGEAVAVNPFLPPGTPVRTAAGRDEPANNILSMDLCQTVLARRAAQQPLPPQLEALIGPCAEFVQQRSKADLMASVRELNGLLRPLIAVGRAGDQVLFRFNEVSYRAQIDSDATIEGRNLAVRAKGATIELRVPDEVLREVGIFDPVIVWRGEVGSGARAAASGAATAASGGPAVAAPKPPTVATFR